MLRGLGLHPGLELQLVVLQLSPLLVHLLLQDVYSLLQLFIRRVLLQFGIGLHKQYTYKAVILCVCIQLNSSSHYMRLAVNGPLYIKNNMLT